MLSLGQPWWLVLLLVLPLISIWRHRFGRLQEGVLRFSAIQLFDADSIARGQRKIRLLHGAQIIFIALCILALSRPQISDTIQETSAEVIDIIMVLDISSSMLAADFQPNRLEAAKKVARQFIEERPLDRIGLVVFAGESFIQCPLTNDTNVLQMLLGQVRVVDKEHDGTAIGMAIANAINRLRDSEAASKVMILLSDGSNNAGELDPSTAAGLAAEFGIKIYTIGAGSHGLAPYPVDDPIWGKRMVKVEVEVDEETLMEVARLTDGRYFRATDKASLEEIYQQINEMERTEILVQEYQNVEDLYGFLLIPAVVLGFGVFGTSALIFKKNLA